MPIYLTVKILSNRIEVKFNDIKTMPSVNAESVSFSRNEIIEIWNNLDGFITIVMINGKKWDLNLDGSNGAYPVSSVDIGNGDVIPTDITHLKELLLNIFL